MASDSTAPRDHLKYYTAGCSLAAIGQFMLRYGLVVILLWIGALKFTPYEAENIKALVDNSPLMSWYSQVTDLQGFAKLLGVIEITIGLMIATRHWLPMISAIGSFLAIGMFLTTLSFVLTTPGVWQEGYGFPFPSMNGQFLAKDIMLLGVAVWSAGEALAAAYKD